MEYALMDDNGIIETFNTECEMVESIDRVRVDNEIKGDIKGIKILFWDN